METVKINSLTQQDIYCKECGRQIAMILGDKEKIILKNKYYVDDNNICYECLEKTKQILFKGNSAV